MNNKYKNYFRNKEKSDLSKQNILDYQKWFFPQYQFILSKVPLEKFKNILEIGSGLGGFYSFLSKKNQKNYIGLELDNSTAQFANSHFNTKSFLNISLEKYRSDVLSDVVFAFEVLEHLDSPLLGIAKIYKLLNENGLFIGTSPYPYYKNIVADDTHNFVLHPENWKRLFLNSGFAHCDIYPMSFIPYLWRINKYLNVRFPFYIPFPYFISTCLIIAKK